MESTCFLLIDEKGKDNAVFTGDTLFIGDVGRPDLAQKAASMTQEQLAGKLYHSLRSKFMTLAGEVTVYPAHGAGSSCGKNMSKETVSTIGDQKKLNYALRADMTEQEFIKEVTDGLLPPPVYFGMNVAMNKSGIEYVDQLYTEFATEYKKDTGEDLNMTREDFIDLIRTNTRKQLQELLILASLFALTLAMGGFEPEDEKDKSSKNLHNFMLRTTDKFVNELSFFYNPKELQNLLSGGMFPAIGIIADAGRFIKHFAMETTGMDMDPATSYDDARKKAQPIKHLMKMAPVTKSAVTYLAILNANFAKEYDVTIQKESNR
jgi:hypothetical protein